MRRFSIAFKSRRGRPRLDLDSAACFTGTTMLMRPVSHQTPHSGSPHPQSVSRSSLSHRPRIVVIDDDRTHVRQVRQALERAGYEPRTGSAWELAPLFVAEAQPVLVILLAAPGSERRGWRVLDELKHAEETQSIPVLVCSAAAPALDTLRGHPARVWGASAAAPAECASTARLRPSTTGRPAERIPTGKSARRVLDC